jgi:hypothetical protein
MGSRPGAGGGGTGRIYRQIVTKKNKVQCMREGAWEETGNNPTPCHLDKRRKHGTDGNAPLNCKNATWIRRQHRKGKEREKKRVCLGYALVHGTWDGTELDVSQRPQLRVLIDTLMGIFTVDGGRENKTVILKTF